jgi:hypothetical protein
MHVISVAAASRAPAAKRESKVGHRRLSRSTLDHKCVAVRAIALFRQLPCRTDTKASTRPAQYLAGVVLSSKGSTHPAVLALRIARPRANARGDKAQVVFVAVDFGGVRPREWEAAGLSHRLRVPLACTQNK